MRLYKRGGTWWTSWTVGGESVRRSTRTSSREAAALVAQRWERERADPAHAASEAARFVDESALFFADVRARPKVPDGTVNMYQTKIGHLNRLMPERMRDVTVDAVDSYFAQRRDEGASGSTMHKEWVALRGVLRSAARRGRWTGQLEILKPSWISPSSAPKERRLTWEELRALLDNTTTDLAEIVRFAVATGARRSEIQRARVGDASRKTNRVVLRGSKTESAKGEIPIPPIFMDLIPFRAWAEKPTKEPLFKHVPADLRCLNAACRAAKIKPISYNDLRRTFGSLLLDAGMTNTIVAQLMRHKSTAMVDRHYGKIDRSALAALVEEQCRQVPVPPVYQTGQARQVLTESEELQLLQLLGKLAVSVGQDGLEPSANGLRDLFRALESTIKRRIPPRPVPPVYRRRLAPA